MLCQDRGANASLKKKKKTHLELNRSYCSFVNKEHNVEAWHPPVNWSEEESWDSGQEIIIIRQLGQTSVDPSHFNTWLFKNVETVWNKGGGVGIILNRFHAFWGLKPRCRLCQGDHQIFVPQESLNKRTRWGNVFPQRIISDFTSGEEQLTLISTS